jgi:hypothetical protein
MTIILIAKNAISKLIFRILIYNPSSLPLNLMKRNLGLNSLRNHKPEMKLKKKRKSKRLKKHPLNKNVLNVGTELCIFTQSKLEVSMKEALFSMNVLNVSIHFHRIIEFICKNCLNFLIKNNIHFGFI